MAGERVEVAKMDDRTVAGLSSEIERRGRQVVRGYALDEERVPRMRKGQVYCPVCKLPADEVAKHNEEPKFYWFHNARKFPCVKIIEET